MLIHILPELKDTS